MNKENFQKLNVGDKIKFESFDGIKIGKITEIGATCLDVQAVHVDSLKEYFVTRRQVISRIVKRKKPKLEFMGTACLRKDGAYHALGPQWVIDSCISKEKHPDDTHEVFVRPIVGKK